MSLDLDPEVWIISVAADAWGEFLALRKAKQRTAPFTEGARKRVLFRLRMFAADGQDVAEILWTSVEAGWTSVYPIRRRGWNPPTLAQTAPSAAVTQTQQWIKDHGPERAPDRSEAISQMLAKARAKITGAV